MNGWLDERMDEFLTDSTVTEYLMFPKGVEDATLNAILNTQRHLPSL